MEKSALQKARAAYQPKLPKALQGAVKVMEGAPTQSVDNQEEIKQLFPNTYGMPLVEFVPAESETTKAMNVGVILSGGQAPGGHNVISGLFDEVKKLNPENRLYGFLMGPGGLVDHKYIEITEELIADYRNTGGFDLIGSGRTKLEEDLSLRRVSKSCVSSISRLSLLLVVTTQTPTLACWLNTMLPRTMAYRLSVAPRPSMAT